MTKHHKDNKKNEEIESIGLPTESEVTPEVIDYEDKYKRALAEHQNLLRSTAKEKEDFRQYAQLRFIEEVLPVYDNLKTSLEHAGSESGNWLEGVKYVVKQFADVLKSLGVTEINCQGKDFDPKTMEAVSEEPTTDKDMIGKIAKEISSGYLLGERVVKPARVIVYTIEN